MKKLILCLLTFCLVLSLAGCGSPASGPAPVSGPPAQATPTEPASPAPTETQTPAPEGPAAPPADPDKVFYFADKLELGRIYRQSLDGSGLVLICDVEASTVAEMGDTLCFISRDALCRCPAAGGAPETVFEEYPVYGICKVTDTVLLFRCWTDRAPCLYRYDTASGQTELIAEQMWDEMYATAGRAVYPVTDPDTYEQAYFCYDPETGTSAPCPENDRRRQTMFASDGFVYEYEPDADAWSRYDLETLTREPVEFGGEELDTLLGSDGTSFLMSSASDRRCIDLVTGTARRTVFRFPADACDDVLAVARKGGTAIVCTVKYGEVPAFSGTELWSYEQTRYFACSVADGTVTEITQPGQAGRMFADGSFPQLDVSTARKPLAMALSNLFFQGYGWDGALPVNSKSHGAWLDLADRGCDIILVPAPTDEENAYLAERGVEVDRKVFGADGLIFISGTGTGVRNLSMDQLKAIYRGEIRNWKELGGADHAITVFYRNDQSGSQRQFEKLVWQAEPMPDFGSLGFSPMNEMETIVMECQADPYAIGYSIMTYLHDVFHNENVVLMGIDGVAPSVETVSDNSYSLTLQDCVVIRSDEPADSPARRLYDWFGTQQCDDLLRRYGLTPVHPQQ